MGKRLPPRLTPAEGRRFALTVGAALLLLGAIAWLGRHPTLSLVLAGCGMLLGLAGLIAPGRLTSLWRVWMASARLISTITTPIILGLVYFGIFAPLGMIRRITGQNPLVRTCGADGYWVRRDEKRGRRSNLERQF